MARTGRARTARRRRMSSKRSLTDQERAQRRAQDRERLKQAAQQLLTSEGWARWVRVRAMFHSYSAGNCMLIALQCHDRGIVPERVAGFRVWLKLGRCVRRNEKALRILAPVTVKERDERRVFFKTAFVFELSQTAITAISSSRTSSGGPSMSSRPMTLASTDARWWRPTTTSSRRSLASSSSGWRPRKASHGRARGGDAGYEGCARQRPHLDQERTPRGASPASRR